MRIEVRQSNRKLLNEPFTQCEEVEKGSGQNVFHNVYYDVDVLILIDLKAVLNHYAVYELQSCRSECLINFLENECLCKPAVFPATIQFDYANYESSDMHQIFEAQNAPICTFKEHVYCAAPLILSFNYTRLVEVSLSLKLRTRPAVHVFRAVFLFISILKRFHMDCGEEA